MILKTRSRSIFLFLFFVILLFFLAVFWVRARPSNHETLTLYGNVDIRQADLGFRVFGKVSKLLVDEGDLVTPGQLLAELDPQPYNDALKQAQGRVESYEAELANANQLFERREGLVPLGSVSEEDFSATLYNQMRFAANLKEARAALSAAARNLDDTHLVSPQEGTILTRVREVGTVVQPGEPIFVVSLATPVWVRAYLSEPNLGEIKPGMAAEIYTDTPSNPVYRGHVGFISPTAEFTPKTVETTELRTDLVYRLRVIVDNPDEGLRQGMPVTVRFKRNV